MTPRLSILLPTYDGGRYLDDQIESILAQSVDDFELVSIDDGSRDDTHERIAHYAARDSRVRILPASGNRGQKRRLAELAAAARSDLLSVADQDDIWERDKLRLLLNRMGDKAMVFGSSWIIDAEGNEAGLTIQDILPPRPRADDRLIYLFKPRVSAHAMIVRRSHFSELSLLRAHPFDWLQALDAIFTDGVTFVPDAITYHRMHGGNQSNAPLGKIPDFWQRMAPAAQKQQSNLRYTERWMTTQRLEHLSYSTIVGPALNAVFQRAYKLCATAWFEIDRPMRLSDPKLAAALVDLLAPLAGSDHDLASARRYIGLLSRSAWQPFEATRRFAAALRGPRLHRRRSGSE